MKKRVEYLKNYQRIWIRARRDAWIKANGPCKLCGSKERLEIDHVEPSLKKKHIGAIWSLRAEKRDSELKKCQVLCKPCHRMKTWTDMGYKVIHGASRYKKGCRCSECKKGHALKMRLYLAKKKCVLCPGP